MNPDALLRIAYGANILILAPVLYGLWRDRSATSLAVFNGAVANSDGLRQLVMALWFAILVCSVMGLAAPRAFIPILILQIVYKSAWLIGFVLPRWRVAGIRHLPWGVAGSFLAIILAWPLILALVFWKV